MDAEYNANILTLQEWIVSTYSWPQERRRAQQTARIVVTIAQGGVLSNIQAVLLLKKGERIPKAAVSKTYKINGSFRSLQISQRWSP